MSNKVHHVLWGLALILSLVLGVTGAEYARDIATRDAQIAASQKEVQQVRLEMVERQKDFEARFAQLEKQKQQIKTSPRAIEALNSIVPLASPIVADPNSLPSAPSATLKEPQLIELGKFAVSCKQCEAERDKNKADSEGKDKIIKEKDKQIQDAKGGGFFKQLKRNSKWYSAGVLTAVVIKAVFSVKH